MNLGKNDHICTACAEQIKSLQRQIALILERTGIAHEALAAIELEAVLDECGDSLNFSPLQNYLKRKHITSNDVPPKGGIPQFTTGDGHPCGGDE